MQDHHWDLPQPRQFLPEVAAHGILKLHAIPALSDNYFWLIETPEAFVAIDPGQAEVVQQAIDMRNQGPEAHPSKPLQAILLTHGHADHVDGVRELHTKYQCPVIGPANMTGAGANLCTGDCANRDDLAAVEAIVGPITVIDTPGHANVHVVYFLAQPHWLFTGDTLFLGGCGRIFTGNVELGFESLQKLRDLPDETLIFAAHELTASNFRFLEHWFGQVVTEDQEAKAARTQAGDLFGSRLRAGTCSYPGSLGQEKRYNPFLATRSIVAFARARALKDWF